MTLGAAIIAYNEQDLIEGCVEGLLELRPVVFISDRPWCGNQTPADLTAERAEAAGAMVVRGAWATEKDQRNAAIEWFRKEDYTHVLMADADEYYTVEDVREIVKFVEEHPDIERFNIGACWYLWKNAEWEILPRYFDIIPVVYKTTLHFDGFRNIETTSKKILPGHINMYHFSYAGRDDRILNKLEHFSHAAEMKPGWFEQVWKRWTPDMRNFHPAGEGTAFVEAIPFNCPEEIRKRFYKRQPELCYNHSN